MKKILLVALLSSVISTGAYAAACSTATQITAAGSATTGAAGNECVCGGLLAGKTAYAGGSGTVVTTPMFVKNGFNVQCSANVFASINEVSTTFVSVGSVSVKGNQSMAGHSAGGAVTTSVKCAGTVCAGSDADTANTAATTAGSSL